MYGDVWTWAGQYRQSEKNIGIQWPLIAVEMRTFLGDAGSLAPIQDLPSG